VARVRWYYRFADHLAALDQELVHLTQESLYFFVVIFLVKLGLWSSAHWLSYVLGLVIIILSVLRYLHYWAVRFVQRLVASLGSERKIELLAARDNHQAHQISLILQTDLGIESAERVGEELCRKSRVRLERIARITQ
jgi:hypothetical protein